MGITQHSAKLEVTKPIEGTRAGAGLPGRTDSANAGARFFFFLALTLTVFEGAIRKWLIGSEAGLWSYATYFSKDMVFAAILLWPAQCATPPAVGVFQRWAIPGFSLFVVGAFLSSLRALNPVGALLTLRAGLILPVLALLVSRRLMGIRLAQVAVLFLIYTVINCGLGVVQSRLPPDHALNRYVLADSPIVALETAVRATGTFSYITGLSTLSSVGIWAGMVLLVLTQKRPMQLLAIGGIFAGFGCALATVSRGPIVMGGLMLLAWAFWSRPGFTAISKSAVVWVPVVLLVCCAGFFPRFTQLGQAVIERHETGEDTFAQRGFGQLAEGLEAAIAAPFGAGLGTEQVGGNYATTDTMSFTTYETQLPRIIAETGLLGLAGYVAIAIGVMLALRQPAITAETNAIKAALLATQLLFLPLLYANLLFNHVASAFVWMIFSALLAVRSSRAE